jgi:hypothetical protein
MLKDGVWHTFKKHVSLWSMGLFLQ